MGRSRILLANCYDYPQYYDIAFQAYTRREADFIEAACRKYCPFDTRRLLEPACGTGRLITELAARGYQVTGFDLSQSALSYLRRRLARRLLHAETFEAEMSDFRLGRPVDAAYCTLRVLRTDLRRRIEDLRVCLLVRRGSKELRLRHEFHFRTYTARQFRRLLGSVPWLELCDVYDSRYDIELPFALNDETAYGVFVLRRRPPS